MVCSLRNASEELCKSLADNFVFFRRCKVLKPFEGLFNSLIGQRLPTKRSSRVADLNSLQLLKLHAGCARRLYASLFLGLHLLMVLVVRADDRHIVDHCPIQSLVQRAAFAFDFSYSQLFLKFFLNYFWKRVYLNS